MLTFLKFYNRINKNYVSHVQPPQNYLCEHLFHTTQEAAVFPAVHPFLSTGKQTVLEFLNNPWRPGTN